MNKRQVYLKIFFVARIQYFSQNVELNEVKKIRNKVVKNFISIRDYSNLKLKKKILIM